MRINQLVFYILLSSLMVSCSDQGTTGSQIEDEKLARDSTTRQITPVRTVLAKIRSFNYLIQSSGNIRAINEQTLIAEKEGFVSYVGAKNTSVVKAGAILLKFNTAALDLQIAQAQEDLFSSKMSFQSDLLSQQSLLTNKSSGVRDTVIRKLKASVGLSQAQANLQMLNLEHNKSMVKAPFHGKVADFKLHENMYVKVGEKICILYSHDKLYLEAKILEADLNALKVGQSALVSPIALGKAYKGKLVEINPIIDQNGMVEIKIEVTANHQLFPGMNANAIITAPSKESLIIPREAVVMRNGKAVVFTYLNGEAKWNYVSIGRDNGKEVEVLNGVRSGQKVIVSNNLLLVNQGPVQESN